MDDEKKKTCLFHTLFPTSLSVQFTIILACYERHGWYPRQMLLHPERYVLCSSHTLYLPLPQDRVQQALMQGLFPVLDDLLQVELIPFAPLAWYQVQCRG